MMKKYLLLTTALTFLSANVYASEVVPCAKGEANCWNCAKDTSSTCTARLSDDGVMTISGKGAMRDGTPWSSKINEIEKVVIDGAITNIGNNNFHTATNLEEVYIYAPVSSIGAGAFQNTTSLTSVNIPASVEELAGAAFYHSGVTSVNFAENSKLQKIGDLVFSGSQISQITLPEGLTSVGNYLFDSCKQLTDVKLPDSLENIGFRMFNGAESLEEIKLPANLKKMGDQAFIGTNITTLEIPEGITSLKGVYLWNIPNIILSDSVKEIDQNALYLYYNTVYCANEEQEKLIADIPTSKYYPKKLFVYQENADDTITVSQKGREIYKYADRDKMLAGTNWLERYEYSDDKKYGGLRQETFAKDGDSEKYIGAKIYRPDGSIVLVDENNKFINKLHAKIYTVEEAMAATRDGNVNRVRLTYK